MKTTNTALLNLIFGRNFFECDLYTITLFNGTVIRFTTADFNVTFGGNTWSCEGVRADQKESKTQAHWKTGLDSDQWVVVLMPRKIDFVTGAVNPDTINGVAWIPACIGGALSAADVQVDRAYFSTMPTWPIPPAGATPVGLLTIFAGTIAEVDITDTITVLTINDYRQLLSISMPRHFYQAPCRFTLFDQGCGLTASNFQQFGTVASGSTRQNIVSFGLLPPIDIFAQADMFALSDIFSPSGSSLTFTLGRIVMKSGLNNTFARTIMNWDGGSNFTLVNPFPFTVSVGDTFTIYPGCNKTVAACAQFNNSVNFGGTPNIPTPELAA